MPREPEKTDGKLGGQETYRVVGMGTGKGELERNRSRVKAPRSMPRVREHQPSQQASERAGGQARRGGARGHGWPTNPGRYYSGLSHTRRGPRGQPRAAHSVEARLTQFTRRKGGSGLRAHWVAAAAAGRCCQRRQPASQAGASQALRPGGRLPGSCAPPPGSRGRRRPAGSGNQKQGSQHGVRWICSITSCTTRGGQCGFRPRPPARSTAQHPQLPQPHPPSSAHQCSALTPPPSTHLCSAPAPSAQHPPRTS